MGMNKGPERQMELAIVDVFTRLIFGADHDWDARELAILQAMRQVDVLAHFRSEAEMGACLRAMGVREMIALVEEVRALVPAPVSAAGIGAVSLSSPA